MQVLKSADGKKGPGKKLEMDLWILDAGRENGRERTIESRRITSDLISQNVFSLSVVGRRTESELEGLFFVCPQIYGTLFLFSINSPRLARKTSAIESTQISRFFPSFPDSSVIAFGERCIFMVISVKFRKGKNECTF